MRSYLYVVASQVAQWERIHLPMQEMWVQFPHFWEEPLEKEMATHSSILVWEIPWTEKPGGLRSMGSQKSQTTTERLKQPPLFCYVVYVNNLLSNV